MGDQLSHGLFHLAVGVQRRFQEVAVECHPERGQVRVLFATQIRHGEHPDGVEIARIAPAGDGLTFDVDAVAAQVRLGDIADVVAVVGIGGPRIVAGLQPLRTRLGGDRQVVDLHAGVVVVELALHVPAVGGHHPGDAVADHAGAAVAHVQRAGRVGGHVLHAHRPAAAAGVAAESGAAGVDVAHLLLPRRGGEVEVDEAGAGDLDLGDRVRGRQRVEQLLRQRPRVAARGLGQQHRRIGGEVAVRALLGTLDHELGRGKVGGQDACAAQGGQALFDQCAELGFHVRECCG